MALAFAFGVRREQVLVCAWRRQGKGRGGREELRGWGWLGRGGS